MTTLYLYVSCTFVSVDRDLSTQEGSKSCITPLCPSGKKVTDVYSLCRGLASTQIVVRDTTTIDSVGSETDVYSFVQCKGSSPLKVPDYDRQDNPTLLNSFPFQFT